MGIILRSAIVIGVIVYLAPLRYDAPTKKPHTSSEQGNINPSEAVQAIWQQLPDSAKKQITEEAQKRLLETAQSEIEKKLNQNGLLPPSPPPAPKQEKKPPAKPSP